jgi:hypothetical protein
MSSESVQTRTEKPATQFTALPKRPWRLQVTPAEHILDAEYEGKGTEEQPYVVDWLKEDPENPMTWSEGYKWAVTMTVAVATLAVAMASSTL